MIAAFLTGLLGSLHCLGMCGPLALALPGARNFGAAYVGGRLLYNLGRVTSYAFLGGLVSLIGVAATMFEVQQYMSLVTGGILIFMALRTLFFHHQGTTRSNRLTRWVHGQFGRLMQQTGAEKLYLLGMLNGLLPCGLVYIGLFQAALAPSVGEGMALMALFGLGTWPVMVGMSLSGNWLRQRLMGRTKRILPILMLVMGMMLTVRGMALGIPYLSPKIEPTGTGQAELPVCHGENEPAHPY